MSAETNLDVPAGGTASTGREWIAFVAPFAAFMLLTTAEQTVRERSDGPEPYLAMYGLKLAVVAGLMIWHRRSYPGFAWRGIGVGAAAGALGVVAWVWLCTAPWAEDATRWVPDWLMSASRAGFDPYKEIEHSAVRMSALILRFAGLALVVPVMEELFWRGFLARWMVDQDFLRVPIGRFTAPAFAATTALFAAVHLRSELFAALTWGAAVNFVCIRTGNLWACVMMHAVTNLLLGAYIVRTGGWTMW